MKSDKHDNRIGGAAKACNNGGFTLAETLLAVLILLLVSTIVATGMPAAVNAYNKVVLGANAKVMLSTAITALHDEIGTAWKVEPSSDNKSLTYFNASTGAKSTISLDANSIIQIQDYVSLTDDLIHDSTAKQGEAHHLVANANLGMYVTYTEISYDEDKSLVTITKLRVCKKTNDTEETILASFSGEDGAPVDFTIRVLSEAKDVGGTEESMP